MGGPPRTADGASVRDDACKFRTRKLELFEDEPSMNKRIANASSTASTASIAAVVAAASAAVDVVVAAAVEQDDRQASTMGNCGSSFMSVSHAGLGPSSSRGVRASPASLIARKRA